MRIILVWRSVSKIARRDALRSFGLLASVSHAASISPVARISARHHAHCCLEGCSAGRRSLKSSSPPPAGEPGRARAENAQRAGHRPESSICQTAARTREQCTTDGRRHPHKNTRRHGRPRAATSETKSRQPRVRVQLRLALRRGRVVCEFKDFRWMWQ